MTAERPARPLLTVKCAIPPVRAGAVPRPRLVDALRAGSTRLTAVVAPAGWGKTSVLSAWEKLTTHGLCCPAPAPCPRISAAPSGWSGAR